MLSFSEYNEFHNAKLKNPDYWNMLSPTQDADIVIKKLITILPIPAEVFEYGTGRGRNSLFLAEKGYQVTAQDIGMDAIVDLQNSIKIKHLDMISIVGDAREIQHQKYYDAFIVIRMLHFLSIEDAMQILQNIKTYTKIGGYNIFTLFSKDPSKSLGFYFPSRDEFLSFYKGWKIIFEETSTAMTADGKEMPRFSILLQKEV